MCMENTNKKEDYEKLRRELENHNVERDDSQSSIPYKKKNLSSMYGNFNKGMNGKKSNSQPKFNNNKSKSNFRMSRRGQ